MGAGGEFLYDTVIIGSGPAGVSASLYLKRAGINVLVISKSSSALIKAESVENYYGLPEPITGTRLFDNGITAAKNLGIEFLDAQVVGVSQSGDFLISSTAGDYMAKTVLIATGAARNTLKAAGAEEFEGRGISYCAVCDAFFFKGKKIAVIGAGEYALHELQYLLPVAGNVSLFTNGAAPTVDFPEELTVYNERIIAFKGGDRLTHIILEDGSEKETDGAFIALGIADGSGLARKLGAVTEGADIKTDGTMMTNIPGVFAAGDCTGGILQISKAVYEGMAAALSIIKRFKKS